jgi:hypothetical protein
MEKVIEKELVMKLVKIGYEPGFSTWWIMLQKLLEEYGYIGWVESFKGNN